MNTDRVDLRNGVVILTDGQRVPITNYGSEGDDVPASGRGMTNFDWVTVVIAGPDADGQWLTVLVTDEDREDARTTS